MANTSILLKRSGLTGITPSSLNFGELALNYYDGKIYYKNASSVITSIGSVNSFANINANSTLILASSGSDTLALTANNGVSVVGNSGTKSINIALISSGTSGNVLTSNGTSWVSSYSPTGAGTVSSVSGTGTVNGLTLTGTVTTTGSLTLGGTLSLGSLNTLGTAAGLSTTLAMGSGGTGLIASGNTGNVLTSTGSSWVSSAPSGGAGSIANSARLVYTATSGQTLFATPPYIPGAAQLSVYISGVKQYPADYAETSNTSVTLVTGAVLNDTVLVEVNGYVSYNSVATGTLVASNGGTGVATLTGLVYGNGTAAMSAATAAQVVGVIGATAVTNATNSTACSGNAAGFPAAGVAEIGRYLDFHGASTGAADYDVRLDGGAGNGTAGSQALNVTAGGGLICNANITAYSDIRLKENISIIPNAMNKLMLLRGVTFTRNDLPDTTTLHTGVIAQEVLAVLPEAVTQNHDGIYSVAYGNMVGLLIEAIKEQQSIITNLSNRLDALEPK